jgi:hypothetical protein
MLDVNGQSIGDGTLELVKFAETASAVNEITVTNSATGNAPEIAATGDDTNIDLKITPKGTGKLNLDGIKFPNADGSSGQALTTNGSGILSFSTISADGTADWDTTVKTTGFTATANKGYFCNTTSAGFTVTLPATPSAGDEVIVLDYAGTFDTNALVINPNGNKIEGVTSNQQLSGEREGIRLVYIDATQGWLSYSGINEGTDALAPEAYSVDFLVVAGGGGAATGGGGAGGFRTSTQTVNSGVVITVSVGDGGAGCAGFSSTNAQGVSSSISGSGLTTITSAGGGRGGSGQGTPAPQKNGGSGGSGGGGGEDGSSTGGSGNTPSTSPSQGNNGGSGGVNPFGASGGGGGASATGSNGVTTAPRSKGGDGGNGTASSITGSSVTYAGGGGGGPALDSGSTATPTGGTGGGGDATTVANGSGNNGTTNLGGGGGGASDNGLGGNGGKGVVILSMPLAKFSGTTTGSPTASDDGTTKRLVFNGDGSYTT